MLGDTAAGQPPDVPIPFRRDEPRTLVAARRIWQSNSELLAVYREPHEESFCRIPGILDKLAADLKTILAELPAFYGAQVRPAVGYLFREWMPIGYAAMLPIEDVTELWHATSALMHYGAAVTVLDDVADSDRFDDVAGPGASDRIAQAVLDHLYHRTGSRVSGLRRDESRVVEFVIIRMRKFLTFWKALDPNRKLQRELHGLLRDFFYSIPLCRRVRARIAVGTATESELIAISEAVPHGMTVALVGLTGLAHYRSSQPLSTRLFLGDALRAQLACHYQNSVATLERELADGDPTNPIVLDAMRRGFLDQLDFMGRRLGGEEILSALKTSYEEIKTRLSRLLAALTEQYESYERLGAGRFFRRYDFGVRNLHFLYRIARGRV